MVESFFTGLLIGGIYALVALSFSIIYTTTRVLNFATGELIMVATMVTYTFTTLWGFPLIAAVIIACAAAVVINLIIKTASLSRLQSLDPITAFMVTLSFGLMLITGAQLVWGTTGGQFPAIFGKIPVVNIASLMVTSQDIATLLIVAVILLVMDFIQHHTLIGKSMVAASEDQEACGTVGINIGRIHALAFNMAAMLCAVVAILLAPIAGANIRIGTMVGLKGFAAGIVGGLTNWRSAVIGGLIFGVTESLSGYIFGGESKEIIIFVLIMAILAWRPTGLWGETPGRKEA
jgi:branched-chain amino acid transport system permease protein